MGARGDERNSELKGFLGERSICEELAPSSLEMEPAFPTNNRSGPWGCTGRTSRQVRSQRVRNDAHADGRWDPARTRGGRDPLDHRPTQFRSSRRLRHFGTITNARRGADAEEGLVAAALADATRGFLWPWRHHALLRNTPRRNDSLDAKKGGQSDLAHCAGRGSRIPFTWCLRELDLGSWSPQLSVALWQGWQLGSV